MGVAIPVITASGEPAKLLYSPSDTAAVLDEASTAFREVLLRSSAHTRGKASRGV